MSGGHFDNRQWVIQMIADEINELIASNNDESLNQFGYRRGRFYTDETITKFKEAERLLRSAALAAHRIDYLVSDDDSEESFNRRWGEEFTEIRSGNRDKWEQQK